ncbi:MAG: PIN domain-containing protein [Acidimicrobiales bacterium]
MTATHLADASAWAQLHRSDVAARLMSLVVGGGVATCGLVDLEVLSGIEDPEEFAEALAERRMFPRVPVDDGVLDRAIRVRGLLLGEAVRDVALTVAAAAELAGLVVLHHDRAFDRIAEVTGQPVESVG